MQSKVDQLSAFREGLATRRYAFLPPDVIIPKNERLRLHADVFAEEILEADRPDVHPHRRRADAILAFVWSGNDVHLSLGPNPSSDPENRQIIRYTANSRGEREYRRLEVLGVAELRSLVVGTLHLVPMEARRPEGLLGIHALRTFGQVVLSPHRDGSADAPVDWVVSYVVTKDGDGAESCLSLDAAGTQVIARSALAPGQLMMHRDNTFFHYVTPLIATGGHAQQREAVIITIRPWIH